MKKTLLLLTISVLAMTSVSAFTGPSIDKILTRQGASCVSIEDEFYNGHYSFDFFFDKDKKINVFYDSSCVNSVSSDVLDPDTTTYCDVGVTFHGTISVDSGNLHHQTGTLLQHFNCEGPYAGQYIYAYDAGASADETPELGLPFPLYSYSGLGDLYYVRLIESGEGRIA